MTSFIRKFIEVFTEIQSPTAHFKKTWAIVITLITVLMSLYHLYYNSYGAIVSIQLRAAHLAFVLALIFLLFPWKRGTKKTRPSPFDLLLAILGATTALYMYFMYNEFSAGGKLPDALDLLMAVTGILLMFEACRRAVGFPLVILASVFLLYAKFGNLAPGSFKIVPLSSERIIYQMYYTETSIFGIVLGVSATFIFIFILFGAFLGENKSSQFFNDISLAMAGHRPGGPAKVAVLASATMGTVSGSAVANVATTGTITIPLMKRVGYKSHFAGAVEAVASSGGSLLPPIMASSAFIMSEMLGVPYVQIITAALIPAILYYVALWVMLDLEARKLSLKGLPKDELPNFKRVLIKRGHLIIPLIVVIYLLVSGRTPLFAGFWGVITTVVTSYLRKDTRLTLPQIIIAMRNGAVASLSPAIACATVGIIVGVSSMTGLGTMLASNLISISGGSLFFTLLMTIIACIVLGMGLPTAAAYITAATVVAPALIELGVLPIAAHLFVLYYAILSNLTPPVALASFTASGIADAPPNKVAVTGLWLGVAGYLVPIMFVYSPILLMQGDPLQYGELALAIITALIGIISLGVAVQNYFVFKLSWIERGMALVIAVLMLNPGLITDMIGIALIFMFLLSQFIRKKKIADEKIVV